MAKASSEEVYAAVVERKGERTTISKVSKKACRTLREAQAKRKALKASLADATAEVRALRTDGGKRQ